MYLIYQDLFLYIDDLNYKNYIEVNEVVKKLKDIFVWVSNIEKDNKKLNKIKRLLLNIKGASY